MTKMLDLGPRALANTRHGLMLYMVTDQYIGRSLGEYGEFSQGEMDLFEKIVKPGDTVVEVGANIGAHTIGLSKLVGTNGSVTAFEPQRIIFQTLCANLALNNIGNVHALREGCSSHDDVLNQSAVDYGRAGNFGAVTLSEANTGEDCPMSMLDEYYFKEMALLKIDVEGMESDVLLGGRGAIEELEPVMYVENDRADFSEGLITLLMEMGYDMWWHTPPLFNPDNYSHNKTNIFGFTISINMLCLPQSRERDPDYVEGLSRVSGPQSTFNNP